MEKRKCPICKEEKELTKEFWRTGKNRPNGLKTERCKICYRIKDKEYAKKMTKEQKEKYLEIHKKYYKKVREKYSQAYKNNISNNLCVVCHTPIKRDGENLTKRCLLCCFKGIARGTLGNFKRCGEIKKLFEEQKGLCFYSGRKLIFGKNASLDHIVPRDKGGTDNIENLRWVDLSVNRAKSNMSSNDFLLLIENIYHFLIAEEWKN